MLELRSKKHWINSFPGGLPELPMSEKYLWVDANGDTTLIGEDFNYAEISKAYPIKIYHLKRTAHNNPENKTYMQRLRELLNFNQYKKPENF